jgi:hypothetical protein
LLGDLGRPKRTQARRTRHDLQVRRRDPFGHDQRAVVGQRYCVVELEAWVSLPIQGAPHAFHITPGFFHYDDKNDVLVLGTVGDQMVDPARQKISVYHLAEDRWEILNTFVDAPATNDFVDSHYVVESNAFYDSRQNLHYLIVNRGGSWDIWAWRYK